MILEQALYFLILFMTLQLADTLFKHFDMTLEKEEAIKKQTFKQTLMQKWAFKNGRPTSQGARSSFKWHCKECNQAFKRNLIKKTDWHFVPLLVFLCREKSI